MSDAVAATEAVFQAKLAVETADGKASTHVLAEGDSFTVGSSEGCEIRVHGEDVAAMHCMIGVTGGKVWLRDCYSPGGTLVNGSRITETTIAPKDEIRIGSCRLLLDLGGPSDQDRPNRVSPPDSSQVSEEAVQVSESAGESRAQESQAPDAPKPSFEISNHETVQEGPGPAVDDSGNIQLRQELDQALAEMVDLRGQLKKQRAQQLARSAAEAADPFQDEMIELLRDEVTQLQAELAQRDAQWTERSPLAVPPAESAPSEMAPASEGLLDRLEQLLDELDHKDEHTRSLEDLLAKAEEATKAEREERAHLESWVTDIEERIGARESEWEATVASLRRQLEERTDQRDCAQDALEDAASGGEADTGGLHERLVENLRQQVASLEHRLAESERRKKDFEGQLGEAPEGGSAVYVQAKVEEQLREERVELARERAALARAQAEFEQSRRQAAAPGEEGDNVSPETWSAGLDSSQRIRALREHLRDVHDEETKQRQSRGLSGRIASLWKRLETRED